MSTRWNFLLLIWGKAKIDYKSLNSALYSIHAIFVFKEHISDFQDYHLDDDTVLDEVSLAEPDRYKLPDLSAEEQALILGIWWVLSLVSVLDKLYSNNDDVELYET